MVIVWEDHLYCDESSPSFLRWKDSVRTGNGGSLLARSADDVAGSLNISTGYYILSLNRKKYKAHRVIF